MRIQVYAQLKEYFPAEMEISGGDGTLDALKRRLVGLDARAEALLESCRFVVKEEFIDPVYKIEEHDLVIIIPPSSGG